MEKILIVDDEKDIVELVSEYVSRWGYQPEIAHNGAEALQKLAEEPIDLILSDLRMPEMNGMELLDNIKEISPDTSVIVFTGYGTVENAVEAIKIGADDYLLKPLDMDELHRKIELAFREGTQRKSYSLVRTLNWALLISIPLWLILAILVALFIFR